MDRDVKFRRNVYLILLGILILAIITQVSRSQFILEYNENEKYVEEHQRLSAIASGEAGTSSLPIDPNAVSNYCLVYDPLDEKSIQLKDNTEQTLKYMKQPYKVVDIAKEEIMTEECSAVLLTTDFNSVAGYDAEIEDYIQDGGYMFIMRMSTPESFFQQMYRKIGIINYHWIDAATGIHLTSNVLIGQEGLKTGKDFIYNNSLQLELDDQTELLAESYEGIPLMWKRTYGEGAFLVYNGDNLYLKSNRGLIAGGISLMQPNYIYPIYNSKMFYIDDFPAPIKKDDENIYADYGMDVPTFFREIWWPDMLKAAKNYNVKYTAVAIQSYHDEVEPPFENPTDEDKHNLIAYGREVIKSGGEIGIHGYNHQSLTMDAEIAKSYEYKPWTNPAYMEASVREMLSYLGSAFPNYPIMTYVPPSNVLSSEGREALKKAWPHLAVIASLYDTDYTNRSYVQEYGIASDGIIELPRITSGYFDKPYTMWLEANAMTSIGVFSHFLHPDDLMSEERSNNQNWKKLYEDFDAMLHRLRDTYPWLRSITSTEAGLDMVRVQQTQIQVNYQDNEVAVNTTADDHDYTHYYILRSDRKISAQRNCSVKLIDKNTYLVTAYEADFSIGLGR